MITLKKVSFVLIGVVLGGLIGLSALVVKANPSFYISGYYTNVATSSYAYMRTGGVSTSTLVYDSLVDGSSFASNQVSLLVQLTSTTTGNPILNTDIQYSQDGIDWYAIAQGTDVTSGIGSTSPSLTNPAVFTFTYASSTDSRVALGPANAGTTSNRILNINIPTRYVRAVSYTVGGTGSAVGVWMQWIGQKQNR